jgi:hypothetical protein
LGFEGQWRPLLKIVMVQGGPGMHDIQG